MIFIFLGVISEDEKDLVNHIFSKMNVKMYHISFNILRSHIDAEEAVAQTFLKIMEHIEKISALPCPQREPYCVIILKNETMNIIRQREKNVYVEDIDYFEHNNQSNDMEEEFIEVENKERLFSCINKLSADEKDFIYLRFVNDMSFKNISQLLNITEEAAKKRGQRILRKLRYYYEGGDKSDPNK
ncbi:sigma-70 family RNA polymerase sigma factor [Anaerocolumna aminovalerica]|uniref:RNA polymerase sigma factor n=1 Tax=Anaerocolumna aminovalerica TaxID=1527 RepID=UPI001C0F27B6|nr:sigma-70 family RNA polymerase sigma factor [Anaerocolumna aminovalerica]MBU5330858.1 sigma-70 family RNA polymerase sigma factor [Anaerocolumna aminovalerica]